MKGYLYRVGIALSILINVILGGKNNQTFSARNHQRLREGKGNLVWMIDKLLRKGHCQMCWVNWMLTRVDRIENDGIIRYTYTPRHSYHSGINKKDKI